MRKEQNGCKILKRDFGSECGAEALERLLCSVPLIVTNMNERWTDVVQNAKLEGFYGADRGKYLGAAPHHFSATTPILYHYQYCKLQSSDPI